MKNTNPSGAQRGAGYALVILTLAQILSYIDRFLPSLVLQPIKGALHLTDFQIGLLLGPAFAVFYIAVGLPVGWLADRGNRIRLLGSGVAIWSMMTAAAAFARSFPMLFAARLGVGLGEATVAPCALSLISDYFPRERRARAINIFYSGSYIGAGAAFLLGGPLIFAVSKYPQFNLPLLGALEPWRLVFLLVGLPGLVLAILVACIREPQRREMLRKPAMTLSSSLDGVRYMLARWPSFGTLLVATGSAVVVSTLSYWNVALFQRQFGWNVQQVGLTTGVLYLTGGPLGTFVAVKLTQRWTDKKKPEAPLRTLFCAIALAGTASVLYPIMPTAELALVALFFCFAGQAMSASGPAALMMISPGHLRAQCTAIYFLVVTLTGQFLGPPLVGWLSDRLGGEAMLGRAMTMEALLFCTPALLVIALGMKHYRVEATRLEQSVAGAPSA